MDIKIAFLICCLLVFSRVSFSIERGSDNLLLEYDGSDTYQTVFLGYPIYIVNRSIFMISEVEYNFEEYYPISLFARIYRIYGPEFADQLYKLADSTISTDVVVILAMNPMSGCMVTDYEDYFYDACTGSQYRFDGENLHNGYNLIKLNHVLEDGKIRLTYNDRKLPTEFIPKLAEIDTNTANGVITLAEWSMYSELKKVLNNNPELIYAKGVNGSIVLHFLAGRNKINLVKDIFCFKNSDKFENNSGYTPLRMAREFGGKESFFLIKECINRFKK
ncbi:hypothetical protein [Shewanella marina]|uniref:hypothetical protein n=1 Tax=Shewanella marina TaxID=487319 RepID=UPI0004710DD2|nr:hypothetical protein [Shewanella marina]